MESGKLDIDTEVKTPKEPVSTYKPIPEYDYVLNADELPKEEVKMAKHDGDTDIEDGAQELMLKNTGRINSNKDASEVKFISENGDAKIDIETVKQTLTGMTKEELMKFANDPFWIRLRWFMFLTFWLLWAAMLAGAVAIIVIAPKCAAPEPRKSWEKSPIVRLDPSATKMKLKELVPVLENLKNKNIKVISLGSVVDAGQDGHTIDFRAIRSELGSIVDFEELIKAAKEREQEIVLELDPNESSLDHPWFKKSVQREEPYTNYYIWADAKTDDKGQHAPPTNWLSVHGGSAWEWNIERKQYYLHQLHKTQPELNYHIPAVVDEFSNILTHWLKLGVSGFRLANTQYLLENLKAGDEPLGTIPAAPESYQSLNHIHTRNWPQNTVILEKWRSVVSNYTSNERLFSLQGDIDNDISEVFNEKHIVDLQQKSQFLYTAFDNITASALQFGIDPILFVPLTMEEKKSNTEKKSTNAWPAWDLNGPQEPLEQRMNQSIAESLTLMTLLLPGTPILNLGQTEYPDDAFKTLTKAREQPAFLHGKTQTDVNNGTVFVYTRLKSGNPGYLVAYQTGNDTSILNLTKYDKVPEEVTIVALSSNYAEEGIITGNRIASNNVPISPKSIVVVQFAPKAE